MINEKFDLVHVETLWHSAAFMYTQKINHIDDIIDQFTEKEKNTWENKFLMKSKN